MKLAEKIFERATITGIANYLLFGPIPEHDGRDYEARLDEADQAYEKTARKYDDDSSSDLLSSANAMANEYACVYMELGLQSCLLLLDDLLKNIRKEPDSASNVDKSCVANNSSNKNLEDKEESESSVLQQFIRYRLDNALEQSLRKDKTYQKAWINAHKKAEKLDESMFTPEQLELIDDALSGDNEQASEYGRVAYQQGLLDTLEFLKEILLTK